jgi:hypothetical protein
MQFWYYGTRIEQECLRKIAQEYRNGVYEVKLEMSDKGTVHGAK